MKKGNPLISVIMPVFNREKIIAESVESILEQTYRNIELIIVDDGSTDSTLNIVKKLSEKDSRIQILKQKNCGPASARNNAIHRAKGDYIAIADSDDISLPTRISKQISVMQENEDIVVCGSGFIEIDEFGNQIKAVEVALDSNAINLDMYVRCPFGHSTCMMRADVLKKVGGYHELKFAEDYELWTRLKDEGRLFNLSDRLCLYRVHSDSVTNGGASENAKCALGVKDTLWKNPPHVNLIYKAIHSKVNYTNNRLSDLLSELAIEARLRGKLSIAISAKIAYFLLKIFRIVYA